MNTLSTIRTTLIELRPEMVERYHVSSIGLFGSIVRDDFKPTSDVDIIVEFNRPVGVEFIDLADFIEQKLQKPVDLVSRNGIRDRFFKEIENEIIYV